MSLQTLVIGKQTDPSKRKKSREFSARLLGMMTAPRLWKRSWGEGSHQPLWLCYVARDAEAKAFTANLRGGRTVHFDGGVLSLSALSPYRFREQATREGLIITAYVPELFDLETTSPYLDDVRFIFAPPAWWLDAEEPGLVSTFGDDAREAARAALFTAYLDRRTGLPILADLKFHLRLYRAACEQEWTIPVGRESYRDLRCTQPVTVRGLEEPFAVLATSAQVSELITTQTQLHFQEEASRGTTRIPTGGRLLSYPHPPAVQLGFDFELALAAG